VKSCGKRAGNINGQQSPDRHPIGGRANGGRPTWRHWLGQLSLPMGTTQPANQRFIIPVALDSTAYNLPTELRI